MDMREFLNRFIDFKRRSKLSLTKRLLYTLEEKNLKRHRGGGRGEYFLKLDPSIGVSNRGNASIFFQLLKTYKEEEMYKVIKEDLRIFNFLNFVNNKNTVQCCIIRLKDS